MIGKNNPLNIRYSRLNTWRGQIGQTRGFVDFVSEFYGVRAALYLLAKSYRKRGLRTYSSMIRAYAPPSENYTHSYVFYVCDHLGVFPFDEPLTYEHFINMLYYMSIYEGNKINANTYLQDKVLQYEFNKEFKRYGKN